MKEGALDTEGAIYMLTEANRYPPLIAHMSKAIKWTTMSVDVSPASHLLGNYEQVEGLQKLVFWGRNNVKDSLSA